MFKIVMQQQKSTRNGDKLCTVQSAKKGTVGMILEEVDMPFMEDGFYPWIDHQSNVSQVE